MAGELLGKRSNLGSQPAIPFSRRKFSPATWPVPLAAHLVPSPAGGIITVTQAVNPGCDERHAA
jgi:hypothetical protein